MAGLVKATQGAIKGKSDAAAFLVLMDKDKQAAAEKLRKLAYVTDATFPLTLNMDGEASPAGYNINPKAKNTVLVYRKKQVVNNFVLNSITEKDLKEISEAAAKNIAG